MTTVAESFYITGGTLRHDAPSYVERQADRELHSGLLAGEFCYVLTSRQMGKSSLMVRTATRLRENATNIAVLDLTAVGQNLTPEQWYDGLLMRLGQQMALEDEVEKNWAGTSRLGPCQRFFAALRDVVLPARPGPLVVFVDEIDSVRSLPFSTDEFFAAIRECFNRRGEEPEFQRLTFCLLGVATPSDLIRDTRTTPFNIGRRVELNDFTETEAAPLAQGLQHLTSSESTRTPLLRGTDTNIGVRRAKRLLSRILYWTGGHPYLTQRFCRAVAERSGSLDSAGVDRICEDLFFSSRAQERDDNLLFVRERLLRSEADVPSLLELYRKVRRGKLVTDDDTSPLISVLRLSGIVKSASGCLIERNRIYSRVFDLKWVQAHLPDADVRRQKAAFQRGVIRTTAVSAVVLAAMTVAVLFALDLAERARKARDQSRFSEVQTWRISGVAGKRQPSLDILRTMQPDFGNDPMLRDEAIAWLARYDLALEFTRSNLPPGTAAVALSPTLTSYALADLQGSIRLIRASDGRTEAEIPAVGLPVIWMLLSPQGRYIAAGYQRGDNDRFVVWNTASGQAVFEATNRVREATIDFSTDNSKMVVCLERGTVKVLTLPQGEGLLTFVPVESTRHAEATPGKSAPLAEETPRPRDVTCVRFDWAGQKLAESAVGSARAYIRNLKNTVLDYAWRPEDITALAWAPDSEHIATAGNSGHLSIWDVKHKRPWHLPKIHTEGVQELAFSPDGTLLASSSSDRTLNVWCTGTGRHMTLELDGETTGRIMFSADSRRLGLANVALGIRIWRVQGNTEYRVVRAPTQVNAALTDVAFAPEGRVLVGANDLGAFLWDTATGRSLASLVPFFSTHSVMMLPAGGDLIVGNPDGLVQWTRQTPAVSGDGYEQHFVSPRYLNLPQGLKDCVISLDGKLGVATYGEKIYKFQTDRPSEIVPVPTQVLLHSPVLSPKGRWLAARSDHGKRLHVWDITSPDTSGVPAATFEGSRHIAFTPDEQHIVTSSELGYQFWSTTTWKELGRPETPYALESGGAVAFGGVAGSGRTLLAVAGGLGTVSLFEFSNGSNALHVTKHLARLLTPDREQVTALLFNSSGSRLAMVSGQTVGIWDLALLQQQLAKMRLAGGLPEFQHDSNGPLTIRIESEFPKRIEQSKK